MQIVPYWRNLLSSWQPPSSLKQSIHHTPGKPVPLSMPTADCKLPGIHQENDMLWTITIILFVLWLVGLVSSYTFGGWIHILLVLAIIVLIFNLLSGRRAL
jgi:hypothetical protein